MKQDIIEVINWGHTFYLIDPELRLVQKLVQKLCRVDNHETRKTEYWEWDQVIEWLQT